MRERIKRRKGKRIKVDKLAAFEKVTNVRNFFVLSALSCLHIEKERARETSRYFLASAILIFHRIVDGYADPVHVACIIPRYQHGSKYGRRFQDIYICTYV